MSRLLQTKLVVRILGGEEKKGRERKGEIEGKQGRREAGAERGRPDLTNGF